MAEIRLKFDLSFSRRFLMAAGAAAMMLCAAPELDSESVTISTYYPAPSGVYTNMITTANTFLARDGGVVGVGTAAPQAAQDGRPVSLDVRQNVVTDDVYLKAPNTGNPRWASQAGVPTVSAEYVAFK